MISTLEAPTAVFCATKIQSDMIERSMEGRVMEGCDGTVKVQSDMMCISKINLNKFEFLTAN